jgi:NAD(P)H-hydrate epimerase
MPVQNLKIVTAAQMAALERASERNGVSMDTLMENAGLAVARVAREQLGSVAGSNLLVLVGPGNNGADGLVTARHLRRWGAEVAVYVVAQRPDPDPKMLAALRYGVSVYYASGDPLLKQLEPLIGRSRMVIDAVLGTGRARPLAGPVKQIIQRLNAGRGQVNRPPVLAVDLPTGLNADTGALDPAGLIADLTVALGYPKVGLLTFPGVERTGRLKVVDIGLPTGMPEEQTVDLELLTANWVGGQFPVRPLNSHKGTFGHLLVVAGSRNFVGAAFLVAQAAIRVGAGLVTLATPESVYPIVAAKLTEVIHLPLPEDAEGRVHPGAVEVIRPRLAAYDALAVGSGMGWSAGTAEFLGGLLLDRSRLDRSPVDRSPGPLPVVLDADGLNNLSGLTNWWRRMSLPMVVTPHPGEMATLTGTSTLEVQRDRPQSARHWSARWGVTVALKGANTVIAGPDGPVRVSPFVNPGLASGGTGDVLTGIIGGLMAQGLSPGLAACAGVYLHGQAGEVVTRRLGAAGTVASDLIQELPETMNWLKDVSIKS